MFLLTATAVVLPAGAAGAAAATPSPVSANSESIPTTAQRAVLEGLESAVRTKTVSAFKALWAPEGFDQNLVGGSGIPGRDVYGQAAGKGWFLRAAPDGWVQMEGGDAVIARSAVVEIATGKTLDEIFLLLIKKGVGWEVLGGGEDVAEVRALAERWKKKQPLAPPKERDQK